MIHINLLESRVKVGHNGHWDDDNEYTIDQWKGEVQDDDTRLGYWDWVECRRTLDSGKQLLMRG